MQNLIYLFFMGSNMTEMIILARIYDGTRNFIYADDLCVTAAQYSSFTEVETTIGDALDELTQSITKSGMEQVRTGEYPHPKYLGVTLDRTLIYKEHMHNTKMKVATRSNLLKKLSNSK